MTFNPNHYDPKSIADIVFPSQRSSDVIHDIISGDLPFPMSGKNGILLYGVPGTGKSALAKLLPDAIEAVRSGETADKLYVQVKQGSNGAAVINQVSARALTVPFTGTHSYFVLDEVDNLTDAAMLSLKSAMNTPNTIYVLTTNYVSKIEAGVISRCHPVAFNAAPAQSWLPLFKRVLTDRGAVIPADSVLLPIIAGCNGAARDIVTAAFTLANQQRRFAAQSQASVSQSAGLGNVAVSTVTATSAGSGTP